MLCALFPHVPVLALTATASKKDRAIISNTLHLKNPVEVLVSPNRPNIYYKKIFRVGPESYESILKREFRAAMNVLFSGSDIIIDVACCDWLKMTQSFSFVIGCVI